MKKGDLAKIFIELSDEATPESFWGEYVGGILFKVRNIPFVSYKISFDDLISVETKGNNLFFKSISQRGKHSTLRIFFFKKVPEDQEIYLVEINKLGCTYERATESLIGIDVPPSVDVKKVLDFLKKGESDGLWEYEEGYIYKRQHS